jgi:hypothetical protein
MAVSMRGDRDFPPDVWFDQVSSLASELNCRIVVVVQVVRDSERAKTLSTRLGGTVLGWEAGTHEAQESVVRELYRRSLCVVSDRIHSLIIGMTEGAAPIGFTVNSPEKVARTFSPVTARSITFSAQEISERSSPEMATLRSALPQYSDLLDELASARRSLAGLELAPRG